MKATLLALLVIVAGIAGSTALIVLLEMYVGFSNLWLMLIGWIAMLFGVCLWPCDWIMDIYKKETGAGCTTLVHTRVKTITTTTIYNGKIPIINFVPVCEYEIDGQTYSVTPKLLASDNANTYTPGETIDLYVSPEYPWKYALVNAENKSAGFARIGKILLLAGILIIVLALFI